MSGSPSITLIKSEREDNLIQAQCRPGEDTFQGRGFPSSEKKVGGLNRDSTNLQCNTGPDETLLFILMIVKFGMYDIEAKFELTNEQMHFVLVSQCTTCKL